MRFVPTPTTALLLAIAAVAFGAEPSAHRMRCTFLGNDTPSPGLCTWELSLRSEETGRPAPNATLYFNYNRVPAEPYATAESVRFEHVNGDLYRLRLDDPSAEAWPLKIRIVASGTIKNITDAPAGFFFVEKDGSPDAQATDVAVDLNIDAIGGGEPAVLQEPTSPLAQVTERSVVPIVPQPVRYDSSAEQIDVAGLAVVADEYLALPAELIADATGGVVRDGQQLSAVADEPGVYLSVDAEAFAEVPADRRDEAYRLTVTPRRVVTVVGGGRSGVLYGAQSLVATIENAGSGQRSEGIRIPAADVLDYPHFDYRGLHLDVGRNFHGVSTVKKLLDLMAAYKLNRFHFHLTDDEGWRLEIRGLPELTEIGGRRGYTPDFAGALPPSFGSGASLASPSGSGHYSRDEFIELLRYATERHIEVIPEIDLPGHARAAIRAMQVRYERLSSRGEEGPARQYLLRDPADNAVYESVQRWNDNVVDVLLPSTLAFVDHVVSDVASMFHDARAPLRTVHFGGDEVPKGCWGDGSTDSRQEHELFVEFMKRCAEIAEEHGAALAGWEEVFLEAGPDPSKAYGPQSACYVWNNIWGWGQEDAAYRLANDGVNVVLCNATHLYFDLAHTREPTEPGYYWAGVTDSREVFGFHPYRYLEELKQDRLGREVTEESKAHLTRLDPSARDRILGMQGHLWGENLNSRQRLEYMAFPRLLALAERAWRGSPGFESAGGADPVRTWAEFSQHVQQHELPRLKRQQVNFRRAVSP